MEVLIFSADWCEACIDFTPFAKRTIESQIKNASNVPLTKCEVVDVDINQKLCDMYHVYDVPTVIFRIRSKALPSHTFEIPKSRLIGNVKLKTLTKKVNIALNFYQNLFLPQ